MGRIYYGTHFVTADEPCLNLSEENQQSPDSRGFHRYQIVHVMRDDKPAAFRLDMGLAKDYTADQFNILGGVVYSDKIYIEHTVGELRDIADSMRGRPPFDKQELVGDRLRRIVDDYGKH